MSSGGALTLMDIVPEYVGSTSRLSPALTRHRSDGVAPQRLIHRRIGNQYSTASVRITRRVGTMGDLLSADAEAYYASLPRCCAYVPTVRQTAGPRITKMQGLHRSGGR